MPGGNELGFELFSQRPPVFITKTGGLSLHLLFRGNGGEITEIVIFGAVGDGFQIFRISLVGDANARNLSLFCHVYSLLFFDNGIVGKLIPGDSAAFLHKPDDAFRVGICLWNLIQYLLTDYIFLRIKRQFLNPRKVLS